MADASNGNGKNETANAANGNDNLNNNEQSSINGGLASQQQQATDNDNNNNNTNTSNNDNTNSTSNNDNSNTANGTTSNSTDNNNNSNNNDSGVANSHHYNQVSSANYNQEIDEGKQNDGNNSNNNNSNSNSTNSNNGTNNTNNNAGGGGTAKSKMPSRFSSKRGPSSQLRQSNDDFESRQNDQMLQTTQAVQNMIEKKDETDATANGTANGAAKSEDSKTDANKDATAGAEGGATTGAAGGAAAAQSQHPEIDRVISKLMTMTMRRSRKSKYITATQTDPKNMLTEKELENVCQQSRRIFMSQPMLIEIDAPIKIVGDIHGQYFDLLRLFELGGMPPEANYVFLGDYVDRGRNSLEVISLLLSFKIKYPSNFFLLRGNHECASINRIYGFFDECKRRYKSGVTLWKKFCDVFNCLPVAAVIDDKIFCMHGGLSPDLRNFDQIRKIRRPTDVPDSGLLCDLLWADPDKEQIGWGENDRGVSYTFGPDILAKFLRKHDMDLVCRAHQVVEDGYEFFGSRRLVTIFSAPNYCGEFDNAGAMMSVDDTLMCSFHILKPTFTQKGTRFY